MLTFACTVLKQSKIYHTRRFIDEELILAIGDFSENLPILNPPIVNNYVDMPIKP